MQKYLWSAALFFFGALTLTFAQNTGQIKTNEPSVLIRDFSTRAPLLTIPKKQKLPINACVKTGTTEESRWIWTSFQGKNGYVSIKTVGLERGAKLNDCTSYTRLAQFIYDHELPLIEAEAAKRTAIKPFLDQYLQFVSDQYNAANTVILQDMQTYPGEKTNTVNLFFKALNCHQTLPMKSIQLWLMPVNDKNKNLLPAPKELTVLGPLDPQCSFAEFKFMGVLGGKNIKKVNITKVQLTFGDEKPITYTRNDLSKIYGCALKAGQCLTTFDAQSSRK